MKATLLGLTILMVCFGAIFGAVALLAYSPEWLLIGVMVGAALAAVLWLAHEIGADILNERSGRWPS